MKVTTPFYFIALFQKTKSRKNNFKKEKNLIEKYSTSRGEIALFITAHSLENNFRTAHIQTFSWKGDIHVDENIKSGKPKNVLFNFVYISRL